MTLYVRNLAPCLKNSDLFGAFSEYGPLGVDIRGAFGFITFTDQYHAAKALENMRGRFLYGRELTVEWARKKPKSMQTQRSAPRERQTDQFHHSDYPSLDRRHVLSYENDWRCHDTSYDDLDNPASDHREGQGQHLKADKEDGWGTALDVCSDKHKTSHEWIQNERYNTYLTYGDSAGLAHQAGRHNMKHGTFSKDVENTDVSAAANSTGFKRGLTNSGGDANNSQSDSKRKKVKKDHILMNQSLLGCALSNSSDNEEVQSDCSSRHADSDSSISSSSTSTRSTGNSQDDGLVIRERKDREVEDLARILSRLDEQQKQAVEIGHKQPCIVTAGPGSGKTRVFVHHIAYRILKWGVNPSSILALTFSNNAAAEMKERLEALLGCGDTDVRKRRPRGLIKNIKTIHGFCVQVLREFGYDHGVPTDFVICNDYESSDAIAFLLDEAKMFSKKNMKIHKNAISTIKTGRTIELRKRFDGPTIEKFESFRRLYDKYLCEMNMLDFDDLILETRRLLRDFPDIITKRLQDRFQHIFVDEWQDTDSIQFDIIRRLSDCHRQLYMVGDPDQSIYKFRGADPKNIEHIAKAYGNTREMFLSRNYRSSGNIVKVAKAVIDQNSDRRKTEMIATEDSGKKVRLLCACDKRDEAFFVARDIYQMKNSGDISSYSDCAVLSRTNRELRLLAEMCNENGIPYVLSKENSFFGQKEIVDMLSLLRVLENPVDHFSVLKIIEVMARKIGKNRMLRIRKHARQTGKTLFNTLEKLTSHHPKLYFELDESQRRLLRECVRTIQVGMRLHEEMRKKPPNSPSANVGSLLCQISRQTKYLEHVLGRNMRNQANSRRYKEKIVQRLIDEAATFKTISDFLDKTALEHTTTKQRGEKPDGVWLSTMHGSKGLEFDTVFVIGVNERRTRMCDDDEERRLLYVAITRAKRLLTLSWRDADQDQTGRSHRKLCTYLRNLPPEAVNDWIS